MVLNIPLEPTPKLRPKFTVRHGRVHALTPYKTKFFENRLAEFYRASGNIGFDAGDPLKVIIGFYIEPPKSVTKKRREMMINGDIRPTVKPDLDNYVKAVLDALNGLAFHDDAQIVSITALKMYCETPHIEVLIDKV